MERELTLARVYHPSFIDNWQLVDHPTVRPLHKGAPDLGWEGDPRLAVYLEPETKTFVLWRLEHDSVYRPVAKLPEGAEITPGSINQLIRRLVQIDARRGFNPADDIEQAQDIKDAQIEKDRLARTAELADKLKFGLARSHLPGVEVSRA